MDWKITLTKLFNIEDFAVGAPLYTQVLLVIFEDTVSPSLYINSDGFVSVPSSYSLKVGGGSRPYSLLQEKELFLSLPSGIQDAVLDLLYILIRRDAYDVSRFQSKHQITHPSHNDSRCASLNRILLNLLKSMKMQWESAGCEDANTLMLLRKVVRLLGNTFLAGCATDELKDVFKMLTSPTALTIPLLQTLKVMTKQDSVMAKASPSSFFNFGGFESGLFSVLGAFPFIREYHIFTWFRVDQFASSASTNPANRQVIAAVLDTNGNGISVFIEDYGLYLTITEPSNKGQGQSIMIPILASSSGNRDNARLMRGVWYHISVRHVKPRLAFFSRDELTVHLDHSLVFQDSIKFPNHSSQFGPVSLVCGKDFNGQLGPVYFLSETIPHAAVEAIACLDAGKVVSSSESSSSYGVSSLVSTGFQGNFHPSMSAASVTSTAALSSNYSSSISGVSGSSASGSSSSYTAGGAGGVGGVSSRGSNGSSLSSFSSSAAATTASDLQQGIVGADKKLVSLVGKFASVYHPDRCCYGHALDVHGGRHAAIGPLTYPWRINSPKEVLESIGGISCLLPMFPKLLIETGPENYRYLLATPNAVTPRVATRRGSGSYCRSNNSNGMTGVCPYTDTSAAAAVAVSASRQLRSRSLSIEDSSSEVSAEHTDRGPSSSSSLLDTDIVEEIESEYLDAAASDSGCVGLLLAIIARCLSNNRVHQKNFATLRGVELLEFALNCIPAEIMAAEGDGCILALLQLRTAVSETPSLESRVNKHLICNFALWSKCSFAFQTSLLAVVVSIARTQPDYFLQLVGIHGVFDLLSSCYMDSTPADGNAPPGLLGNSRRLSMVASPAGEEIPTEMEMGAGSVAEAERKEVPYSTNSNNNNRRSSQSAAAAGTAEAALLVPIATASSGSGEEDNNDDDHMKIMPGQDINILVDTPVGHCIFSSTTAIDGVYSSIPPENSTSSSSLITSVLPSQQQQREERQREGTEERVPYVLSEGGTTGEICVVGLPSNATAAATTTTVRPTTTSSTSSSSSSSSASFKREQRYFESSADDAVNSAAPVNTTATAAQSMSWGAAEQLVSDPCRLLPTTTTTTITTAITTATGSFSHKAAAAGITSLSDVDAAVDIEADVAPPKQRSLLSARSFRRELSFHSLKHLADDIDTSTGISVDPMGPSPMGNPSAPLLRDLSPPTPSRKDSLSTPTQTPPRSRLNRQQGSELVLPHTPSTTNKAPPTHTLATRRHSIFRKELSIRTFGADELDPPLPVLPASSFARKQSVPNMTAPCSMQQSTDSSGSSSSNHHLIDPPPSSLHLELRHDGEGGHDAAAMRRSAAQSGSSSGLSTTPVDSGLSTVLETAEGPLSPEGLPEGSEGAFFAGLDSAGTSAAAAVDENNACGSTEDFIPSPLQHPSHRSLIEETVSASSSSLSLQQDRDVQYTDNTNRDTDAADHRLIALIKPAESEAISSPVKQEETQQEDGGRNHHDDDGDQSYSKDADEKEEDEEEEVLAISSKEVEVFPTPVVLPVLSREQRRHLRVCLLSIIMGLISYSPSEKEIRPLLQFLAVCKDPVVLNDVSQLLLSLIVDGNSRILAMITEVSQGAEEFASLIIHRVIQMPEEDVRCTGVRLLTHFYLRLENLPSSLLGMTIMRKKKSNNFIHRAMEKIQEMAMVTGGTGLQRLQASGGLALLCEILTAYTKDGQDEGEDEDRQETKDRMQFTSAQYLSSSSKKQRLQTTELTYLALLEMLLTMPEGGGRGGGKSQATMPQLQYSSVFDAPSLSPYGDGAGGGGGSSSSGSSGSASTKGFASSSPDLALDETAGHINPVALPIIFDMLPKLPLAVQGRVVSDLLALIKHNSVNRKEFCAVPSWHMCMYGIVSRFISRSNVSTLRTLSTEKLANELEKLSAGALSSLSSSLNDGQQPERLPPKSSFRVRSSSTSRRSSRCGSIDLHSSPAATAAGNDNDGNGNCRENSVGGGSSRLLRGWANGDAGQDKSATEQRRHAPPARPHVLPLLEAAMSPPPLSRASMASLLNDNTQTLSPGATTLTGREYPALSYNKDPTNGWSASAAAAADGGVATAAGTVGATGTGTSADKDLWFALGMKAYASLLLRCLDTKGGWREIDRTVAQAIPIEHTSTGKNNNRAGNMRAYVRPFDYQSSSNRRPSTQGPSSHIMMLLSSCEQEEEEEKEGASHNVRDDAQKKTSSSSSEWTSHFAAEFEGVKGAIAGTGDHQLPGSLIGDTSIHSIDTRDSTDNDDDDTGDTVDDCGSGASGLTSCADGSVARAVLSHLVSETTFSIRSKYRHLQKLSKSTSAADTQLASDRLENILSLIVTSSQYALGDRSTASFGIDHMLIGTLRSQYYTEAEDAYFRQCRQLQQEAAAQLVNQAFAAADDDGDDDDDDDNTGIQVRAEPSRARSTSLSPTNFFSGSLSPRSGAGSPTESSIKTQRTSPRASASLYGAATSAPTNIFPQPQTHTHTQTHISRPVSPVPCPLPTLLTVPTATSNGVSIDGHALFDRLSNQLVDMPPVPNFFDEAERKLLARFARRRPGSNIRDDGKNGFTVGSAIVPISNREEVSSSVSKRKERGALSQLSDEESVITSEENSTSARETREASHTGSVAGTLPPIGAAAESVADRVKSAAPIITTGAAYSTVAEKPDTGITDSNNRDHVNADCLSDFRYRWLDIDTIRRDSEGSSQSQKPRPSTADAEAGAGTERRELTFTTGTTGKSKSHSPAANATAFVSSSPLSPLERRHSPKEGQLVLVLQTLRLFDTLFWPKGKGPLRNCHMLRYLKEDLSTASRIQQPVKSGMASQRPSMVQAQLQQQQHSQQLNLNTTSSSSLGVSSLPARLRPSLVAIPSAVTNGIMSAMEELSVGVGGQQQPTTGRAAYKRASQTLSERPSSLQTPQTITSPVQSLYTSALRMTIYTLQTLSPFSELASLNVRRLTELINVPVIISSTNSPIDDWCLAAVLQVTVALQRISTALAPVYSGILQVPVEHAELHVSLLGVLPAAIVRGLASTEDTSATAATGEFEMFASDDSLDEDEILEEEEGGDDEDDELSTIHRLNFVTDPYPDPDPLRKIRGQDDAPVSEKSTTSIHVLPKAAESPEIGAARKQLSLKPPTEPENSSINTDEVVTAAIAGTATGAGAGQYSDITERLLFQGARHNHKLLNRLVKLFSSSEGRNLEQFIRDCKEFLLRAFDSQRELLMVSLEPRIFLQLESFVCRIAGASEGVFFTDSKPSSVQKTPAVGGGPSFSSSSPGKPAAMGRSSKLSQPQQSAGVAVQQSAGVAVAGGGGGTESAANFTTNNNNTNNINYDLSDDEELFVSTLGPLDGGGSILPAEEIAPRFRIAADYDVTVTGTKSATVTTTSSSVVSGIDGSSSSNTTAAGAVAVEAAAAAIRPSHDSTFSIIPTEKLEKPDQPHDKSDDKSDDKFAASFDSPDSKKHRHLRPQSKSPRSSRSSPRSPRGGGGGGGGDERLKTARHTLRALSLLRDPYLKVDPLRSVGIVRAVSSLDLLESSCCSGFVEDLAGLRRDLETHRGMGQRAAEDAAELRELSTMVLSSLVSQERSRISALHSHEAIELKHTAATWHKCLCALEMDWSPWAEEENDKEESSEVADIEDGLNSKQEEEDEDSPQGDSGRERSDITGKEKDIRVKAEEEYSGKAYFELSKHKDSKMRRFITMRLPDVLDHSTEAYLDGKQRDQQQYETSTGGLAGTGITSSSTSSAAAAATAAGGGGAGGGASPMQANMNLRGLAKSVATSARSRRVSVLSSSGNSINTTSATTAGNGVGGGVGSQGANGLLSFSADVLDDDEEFDTEYNNSNISTSPPDSSGGNKGNRRASDSGTGAFHTAGTAGTAASGVGIGVGVGVGIFEGIASTVGTVFAGQSAGGGGGGTALDKRPQWTQSFNWAYDEKMFMVCHARQVELEHMISGMIVLTNKALYFHPKKVIGGLGITTNQSSSSSSSSSSSGSNSSDDRDFSLSPQVMRDRRWQLDRLVELYRRRYLLQNCAIELFFADVPEVFFAFDSTGDLQKFFRLVRKQYLPLLVPFTGRSLNPRVVCAQAPWMDLWRRRLISNFEYLMRLNVMAGRSYNDITQYPVFPWILADYTSDTLELQNPLTFRDLSKPIGALNPSRLHEFVERYNSLDDDDTVPRFMYGSHYSSAGLVIHYMVRQEPFTTLAVNLQGGRFDCPDRVFFDLKSTWDGCNRSMSDVKELIPELFCCPEVLLNTNKLPLGKLQDTAQIVDDVVLPPWAHGDAFEFVRLNREALESDYVSEHLHDWIDLIFGYKQTGPASVEASNVFYYLTYEDAVDLDAIEDPLQREAAKAQVLHFGQTPSQLFTREHPRRLPREECMVPLCADIYNISHLTVFTPTRQQYMFNLPTGAFGGTTAGTMVNQSQSQSHGGVISIKCSSDRLVTVHADLSVSVYKWSSFPDGEGSPFQLRTDTGRIKALPCAALARSELELRRKSFVPAPRTSPHPLSSSPYREKSSADRRSVISTAATSYSSVNTMSDSDTVRVSPATATASSTFDLSWFRDPFRRMQSTQSTAPKLQSTQVSTPKLHSATSTLPSKTVEGSVFGTDDGSGSGGDGVTGGPSRSASLLSGGTGTINSSSSSTDAQEGAVIRSRSPSNQSFGRSDDDDDTSDAESDKSASTEPSSKPEKNLIINSWSDNAAAFDGQTSATRKLSDFGSKNVALSIGEAGLGRVISCGYWDNSLKVHALDTLKEVVNSGGAGSNAGSSSTGSGAAGSGSSSGGHMGEVTCVQLGYKGGHLLISGGADGTCRVWVLENPSLVTSLFPDRGTSSSISGGMPGMMAAPTASNSSSAAQTGPAGASSQSVSSASGGGGASSNPASVPGGVSNDSLGASSDYPALTCVHVLCGHSSPITAISYASDPDIVLSASRDGLLCVHTARKGQYIRSIKHMMMNSNNKKSSPLHADIVLASSPGYLVAHSWAKLEMHVFWINGQHRATVDVASKVEALAVNGSGNVLVCGHVDGTLSLRALWNLQQTHKVDHSSHGAIRSLCFTDDCQFLLIGSEDGSFSVGTDPDVRWKMLHAAIQKTPLLGPTM